MALKNGVLTFFTSIVMATGLTLPTTVWATDWRLATASPSGDTFIFVDVDSIVQETRGTQVWAAFVRMEDMPDGEAIMMQDLLIDCRRQMFTLSGTTNYALNGSITSSNRAPPFTAAARIPPQSIGGHIRELACDTTSLGADSWGADIFDLTRRLRGGIAD